MRRFNAILCPLLLSWGLVLATFNSVVAPVAFLPRPLLLAGALGLSIGGLATLAFRRTPHVGLLAGCAMTVLLVRPYGLLGVGGATAGLAAWYQWRRLRRRPIQTLHSLMVARATTIGVAAFFVVTCITAVSTGDWSLSHQPGVAPSAASTRNFYLVLLDGYPRADALQRVFDYDNRPFLDDLQQLGFDVYPDATSQYLYSAQALASVFGHAPRDGEGIGSLREWRRLLSNPRTIEPFRTAGYEFVAISPPVGMSVTDGADRTVATGQINDFEAKLVADSVLPVVAREAVLGWIMESWREGLEQSLDGLLAVAETPHAKIVLAHVMAPHPPFLWDGAGVDAPGPECWPRCHIAAATLEHADVDFGFYSRATRGQLDGLNHHILAMARRLVGIDPQAVIVFFGDHGTRYVWNEDSDEAYSVLLAARTPGHPNVLHDDQRIATLLERLAEAYIGQ